MKSIKLSTLTVHPLTANPVKMAAAAAAAATAGRGASVESVWLATAPTISLGRYIHTICSLARIAPSPVCVYVGV
jgi:hypothetical protein